MNQEILSNQKIFTGDAVETDTWTLYLQEINQIPLLTREQEIQLGKLIKQGQFAENKLSKDGYSEEERSLLTEQCLNGKTAVLKMFLSNLRLVPYVALRFNKKPNNPLFLDIIQEGNYGLMRAAETFDYEKGRFSTHAFSNIRAKMRRFNYYQGGFFSLPDARAGEIHRFLSAKNRLKETNNREPTDQELLDDLEISAKRLTEIIHDSSINSFIVSLDEFSFSDGEETKSEHGDFICDKEAVSPEQACLDQNLEEIFSGLFDKLTPRERRVMMLRFGFEDDIFHTLEEIGQELSMTREGVRLIEKRVLQKMRGKTRVKKLQEFLRS